MDKVTIADLIAADKMMEIGCYVCKLHMYVDACLLAVPDDTPVPQVCDHIGCPNPECGMRNPKPGHGYPIWTRPDSRPPRMEAG